MLKKRNVTILSLALLTATVLFNFQNCAPAAVSAQTGDSDSEVRIVDDFSKTEIQFATEQLLIHDEAAEASVSGLCTRRHNGAELRWALYGEGSSRPIVVGDSLCKSGQFAFEVGSLDNLVCGVSHRLVVEGDWGGIAVTQFEKRCQPIASEEVAAPPQSPIGTQCSLEYVPVGDLNSACTQVCYREQKVVFSIVVDSYRCAGLAQKLASP